MDSKKQYTVVIPGIGPTSVSAERPLLPHLHPLLEKDDRQKFWINRSWPEDAFGKVFLGRATIRVGAALFPGDWVGHEPGVDTSLTRLPMFPPRERAWETRKAMSAVPSQDLVPEPPVDQRVAMQPRSVVDQRNWEKAVAIRDMTLAEIDGPRLRWAAATHRLREAMKEGQVKFHVRVDATGDYSDALSNKWWNTDHWAARFYFCRLNKAQPITAVVGGTGFQWIFVDGEDLNKLIGDIGAHLAPATSLRLQGSFKVILLGAVQASERNPHNRDYWADRARNEFGLPREVFDQIWSDVMEAVPTTKWNAPGRPPKKPV